MKTKYLKPIEKPGFKGCLCCGLKSDILNPEETILAVGFGGVTLSRDGKPIFNGDDPDRKLSEFMPEIEKAKGADWRLSFFAPLYDAEYQYQNGHFVLVGEGLGFA